MSVNLKVNAIILRRVNYGESDRILTVLTPKNGEIAVLARGTRKEKSRLAGGIELFSECQFSLIKSSLNLSGMWTLTSAKIIKFYDSIITDYDRLQFGYETIKQVSKISKIADSPLFYELLVKTFAAINNLELKLDVVKVWFYLQLANISGYGLNLSTDINGMKLIEDTKYNFNINDMVFVFDGNGKYDTNTIKLLRLLTVSDSSILPKINSVDSKTLTNALYLSQVANRL